MSPRIQSDAGQPLTAARAYLTRQEAIQLWDAMNVWVHEPDNPEWNCDIADSDGRKLTVTVGDLDNPRFASRFAKPS